MTERRDRLETPHAQSRSVHTSRDHTATVQSVAERRECLERAEPTMYYFRYEHLPKALQAVSIPFWSLAADMVRTLPGCTQRTLAIQKLLESKDAAVRAALKRC